MLRGVILCFFFTSLFISDIFSQDEYTIELDTTLSDEERIFQDSISRINFKNQQFAESRQEYNYGLELFEQGDLEESIEHFTNAIIIDSTFSQAYLYRGRCYDGFNDSLALKDYVLAFSLDSSDFSPLYKIARIQSKNSIDESIHTYNIILGLSDKESKAFYKLGVLYYLQDSLELAIVNFTNSIELKKKARAFNDRASCYRILGKIDLAIQDYTTAISLDPKLPFIYNNLASAYRISGRFQQALAYYSRAIEIKNDYALAYNNRASLYIDLGNLEAALDDVEKCIFFDASYAPAYNNKGVIYHQQVKYVEAIACFDQAILLDSNYAKAFLNRGITRQIIRDEDGACNDWLQSKILGIDIANKYLVNDCN